MESEQYGYEELASLLFDVPIWIESDITLGQMKSIVQCGCASGAYMPAVTYHEAMETMKDHGDDVLEYIENSLGEVPTPSEIGSWSGLAVYFLSCAVELWATQVDYIELVD